MNHPRLAYICFDVISSAKGATTHIKAFSKCLSQGLGEIELITVSPGDKSISGNLGEDNIYYTCLPALGKTLIHRVLYFRQQLKLFLNKRHFEVIHIRSIYEGFPIAVDKKRYCEKLVFEVNGLPSIELKYRYPDIVEDRELMYKLLNQERICLEKADLIVTPSNVTRAHVQCKGISSEKIVVIPNGVDLSTFTYCDRQHLDPGVTTKILYFGVLSSWQGVDIGVRAIALCHPRFPIELKIIGAGTKEQIQGLKKLIEKLEIGEKVTYIEALPQKRLVSEIHQTHLIIAPLINNDRNRIQGCCPLKILEAMAAGTPVITSDLPVTRELGEHQKHFYLVKANSVQEIADAIEHLRSAPDLREHIRENARQQVENHFTWEIAGSALRQAYESIGINLSKRA